jgi:hypothetical protein
MNNAAPKWLIADVITYGRQAKELSKQYRDEIVRRMKLAELEELETGIDGLDSSKAGQSEKLVVQKTGTKNKDLLLSGFHISIIDIRGLVKAAPKVTAEKLSAFGVGMKTKGNTVSENIAAANMIIDSFEKFKEWAISEAGILEEDIELLKTSRDQLKGADESQDIKVLERKVTTVDKNVLQRRIEELITKVSAVGVVAFRTKQPSLVPLFEALIPGNGSGGNGDTQQDTQPEPAATTTA